jgi:hypothetical protein
MYCGGSSITSCPWARKMGAQHPRPVMRRAAGLQPDPGRRQLGKERFHLLAAKPATQHRLLLFVDTVQLKDMLGGIQANSDNTHRTAPLLDGINLSLAHSMPSGAVHPNRATGKALALDAFEQFSIQMSSRRRPGSIDPHTERSIGGSRPSPG